MFRFLVVWLCFAGAAHAQMIDLVTKGSTDRSVTLYIFDSTDGTPETGVLYNTSGIDLWYRREGATKTSITEAVLATPALDDAHADGGFLEIGNGYYRLDLPDAAFATGANYVDVGGTVTGMVVKGGRVRLTDWDIETAVATLGGGATSLDVDANGRVRIVDGTGAGELDTSAGTVSLSAATETQIDDILTDTGTTLPASISGLNDPTAAQVASAVLAAIGMQTTTIATFTSNTSFTLTAGSANDNAYNDWTCVVIDQSTATQVAVSHVLDYTGSTKTVTLFADDSIFTFANGDTVVLIPNNKPIQERLKDTWTHE